MQEKNRWLRPFSSTDNAACVLVCFPWSGGNAYEFKPWAQKLPSWISLAAIQYPGRSDRCDEPLESSLSDLVLALIPHLAPMFTKPIALLGHSLGSLVAYEAARMLVQEHGKSPIHLFVSGREAPHLPDDDPIQHLSEPDFIAKLIQFQGLPEAILNEPELRDFILPIIRNDVTMGETYVHEPSPPLAVPISAGYALQDTVTSEKIHAWQKHTSKAFTYREYAGSHFFFKENPTPFLEHICTDLKRSLLTTDARPAV